MKSNKFTHVCISLNVYSLLQYLLNHDEDIILNKTRYFLGQNLAKDIAKRLPNTIQINIKSTVHRLRHKLYLALFSRVLYPELKTALIYAQDHRFPTPILIGRRNYTLLSDSCVFLTHIMNPGLPDWEKIEKRKKSLVKRIKSLLFGHLTIYSWGTSKQCKSVLLTQTNHSPVLENKDIYIKSLEELWETSSEEKRKSICYFFNMNKKDVAFFNQGEVIVFTQCFYDDGMLTKEEHLDLYKMIIDNYPNKCIIIKPHPRDTLDYQSVFPQCLIFSKPIPIELLVLSGSNIKAVATIYSTAALCFPEHVKVDWYGTKIHKKLLNECGDL